MAKAKRTKRKAKAILDLAADGTARRTKKAAAKFKSPAARAAAAVERTVDRVTGKAGKRLELPTRIEPPARAGRKKSTRKTRVRGKWSSARTDITQAVVSGGVRVPRRR